MQIYYGLIANYDQALQIIGMIFKIKPDDTWRTG
jgi:hypothetical protein